MNTMMPTRDQMLVCRNGHVLTDRLRARPDLKTPRCERCGADTFDCCRTCGREILGAELNIGPEPLGARPAPPACIGCGVQFPWAAIQDSVDGSLAELESLLRRLPRVARGIRSRFGEIRADSDLSDLLRGLLHVRFDEVYPIARTPRYSASTRTDFRIPAYRMAIVGHCITREVDEDEVYRRLTNDVREFEDTDAELLIALIYDPMRRLPTWERVEAVGSRDEGSVGVRCIVTG